VQRQLSHFPGPDWACFSPAGRQAASKSNIALGYLPREHSVADNVMSFFKDLGANNLDGVGHRRWLQSPQLGAVGYGLHVAGTDVGSCFDVTSNRAASVAGPQYITYPNPGPVPLAMLQSASTPWSVAVDAPSGATWPSESAIQVRVDRLYDGGAAEVETEHINVSTDRVGYTYAVVFLAKWGGLEGRYRVRIEGLPVEVDYETDIRSCAPFGG